jgi:Dullard-like phosphatase family protein
MKKLFWKSKQNSSNLYINQETTKPESNQISFEKFDFFSKDMDKKQILNSSFFHNNNNNNNNNNVTIDYSKNYSPSFFKSPFELPKIQNQKKNAIPGGVSKISGIKHIMISNSSTNIHSQNLLGINNSGKKLFKRDKTQAALIKEEESDSIQKNESKINNASIISKMNEFGINKNNNSLIKNNNNNNIIKNRDEISLFRKKIKNSNNINNITNINIHIYSSENQTEISDVNNKRNTVNSNINSNKKNIITSKDMINKNIENLIRINKNVINNNNNSTIETTSNVGNRNNMINLNNINTSLFPKNNNFNIRIQKKKKATKKYQRNGHSSSVEGNKNTTLAIAGNIIMNNSKINLLNRNNRMNSKENKNKSLYRNKICNNSLPEINLTQIEAINKKILQENQSLPISSRNKTLNEVLEEYEEMNINDDDIEKVDNCQKFIIDINSRDKQSFGNILKIIQIHLDIELLFNSLNINNVNNNCYENNSPLRKKIQINVGNDKRYKLFSIINNYFVLLTEMLNKVKQQKLNNDLPFFESAVLNKILFNCLKCQICLYSSMLISFNQLAIYDFNIILKNYFSKIVKEISFSLFNIFEFFLKEELQTKHQALISQNLRNDFNENLAKISLEHKINKDKKSVILKSIICNIEKSVNSLKFYSSSNLKYSLIKPYGDSLNQLLFSFDRKTFFQFVEIFLYTILYGELDINKKNIFSPKNAKNNTKVYGNSVMNNNVKDSPPFLPSINPKYKYTLVLDVDETLIHFFFTYINGMFFVRPHCFDFLKETSKYYEIVTFTAGTKDYADNILNLLDINDNLIKYRLYRQHTTIMGCSVFKDLNNLGRDLSKIIIIDNLKDNFKLQPNNGLFIKTWSSDVNDIQFQDLARILKDIAVSDIKDVRPIIEKINDDIKLSRNIINPYSNIDINKILVNQNILIK